ncbi:MAG: imelysin family protein, partial [Polaromonas sp.]
MKPLLLTALLALPLAAVPALAQPAAPSANAAQAVTAASVAQHYGALVQASYDDSLGSTLALQKTLQAFLDAPSEEGLKAARQAWLAAREFYGQTEAFRFYGGPIDDKNGPEGRINAWPMDESYVDYVKTAPGAGIINNRKVALSKKQLASLNERNGEENIATGWHAIEFLLWGQDLSPTGPGNRS